MNIQHGLQLCTNEGILLRSLWTLRRTAGQVIEQKMQSGERDYCGNQESKLKK